MELRHRYLARAGRLDLLAFDPVSTALAKVARGRARDVRDIASLARVGWVDETTLRRCFEEIIPRVEAGESLRIDATAYRARFERVMAVLTAMHPQPVDEERSP